MILSFDKTEKGNIITVRGEKTPNHFFTIKKVVPPEMYKAIKLQNWQLEKIRTYCRKYSEEELYSPLEFGEDIMKLLEYR